MGSAVVQPPGIAVCHSLRVGAPGVWSVEWGVYFSIFL